ncbi:hypothetical protein CRUP_012921 [Coryphaenoides rupestris]|nr:hypothetical protein CRUP_012921 [Coryphaenoides rupestris]
MKISATILKSSVESALGFFNHRDLRRGGRGTSTANSPRICSSASWVSALLSAFRISSSETTCQKGASSTPRLLLRSLRMLPSTMLRCSEVSVVQHSASSGELSGPISHQLDRKATGMAATRMARHSPRAGRDKKSPCSGGRSPSSSGPKSCVLTCSKRAVRMGSSATVT